MDNQTTMSNEQQKKAIELLNEASNLTGTNSNFPARVKSFLDYGLKESEPKTDELHKREILCKMHEAYFENKDYKGIHMEDTRDFVKALEIEFNLILKVKDSEDKQGSETQDNGKEKKI